MRIIAIGGGGRRPLALALSRDRVWRGRRRRATPAPATRTSPPAPPWRSSTRRRSSRVGTKFDQPGFGLKGLDGKPAGFDVEIAKIVAKDLGIPDDKIEYTETPSTVREQVIEQGKVDIVVATYTINDKRKAVIDFAGPYYMAGQYDPGARPTTAASPARTRSRTAPRRSARSPTRRRPTTSRSTSSDKAKQLVLFDIYQKCVDALKGGQVDAVTTDNVILLGFVATNEGQFKLAGTPFTEEPYGIGLKKDDNDFRDVHQRHAGEVVHRTARYKKAWKDTAGKFDPTPTRRSRRSTGTRTDADAGG